MKKFFFLIFSLLLLTSCGSVELNPEWYPTGWAGKDTVFVTRPNGKFDIGQSSSVQTLSVNTDDGMYDTLLSFVTDHKRSGDKVYVYSDEGYCVIDEKSNTAEILVTAKEQYFSSGTNDPSVTYLESFNEFSDKAKKIFGEMEEYWSDKEYRRYGSYDRIYPDGIIVYSDKASKIFTVLSAGFCILVFAIMVAIIKRPPKQEGKKEKHF